MPIDKLDVMFESGETFAAGWFYLPAGADSETRVPAVAMALSKKPRTFAGASRIDPRIVPYSSESSTCFASSPVSIFIGSST